MGVRADRSKIKRDNEWEREQDNKTLVLNKENQKRKKN